MQQDEQHLKLLAVFHYVVGGMAAVFACFPIFHLIMGIVVIVLASRPDTGANAPPVFLGWVLVGVAGVIIITGWTLAALMIAAGRCLSKRRHYMFCLVIAAIECVFMPCGTVLGVFTIIVLMKDNVKEIFATTTAPSPARAV